MKFLIIPCNNSLSHLAKGIALRDFLLQKNHEALIAVGKNHEKFTYSVLDCCEVLPDIQEVDGSPFPTLYWFKYTDRIISCINSEVELIKRYRPDAVIGIFRFTAKLSSCLADVPYYSLVCGCMLPENREVLGFLKNDPGHETQRFYLQNFNMYSTVKINRVLKILGTAPVYSFLELLKGDKTFLWDFPEFMPLECGQDVVHAGPIYWDRWPYDSCDLSNFMGMPLPLAVVSFGTGIEQKSVTQRISSILVNSGYKVMIANGGNGSSSRHGECGAKCAILHFAPLHEILENASVLITHGGQMTLFEALKKKVPVAVMPFQPEQDHNGLCVERLSCGRRLIRCTPFSGDSGVYIDALNRMSDRDIESSIEGIAHDNGIHRGLSQISSSMSGYSGIEAITEHITTS